MALSTKLLSTLNEESEPLKKRLKIADNALKYVDLPIQKREVFLLKWLIDLESDDQNVWQKLFEWISSNNINNMSRNDLNEDDFVYLNNAIIKKLSTTDNIIIKELLIKTMHLLVENQTFLLYYMHYLKQYFDVLSNLLECIEDQDVLIRIIKNDFLINLGHVSKESCSALLDFIVKNLTGAFIKFESTIFKEAVEFVQKSIFHKNLRHYENYYSDFFNLEAIGDVHYGPKLFFKKLKSVYKLDVQKSSFLYKVLFSAYYGCAKNDYVSTYKFMILLTHGIGFDLSGTITVNKTDKIRFAEVELDKSLAILSMLFEVLSMENFNTEITLADVSASTLFQNLLYYILNLNCSTNYPINIVEHIIILNPLIIETLINDLLIFIMFNNNEESRIILEQLFVNVMEVFAKLHRIQNIISKMIPLLKLRLSKGTKQLQDNIYKVAFSGDIKEVSSLQKDNWNASTILPEKVLNYFTKCITSLASWQVMNLFMTFLFHFKDYVDNNVKQNDKENLLYIEVLSVLICQFLSSVRMAEHTISTIVVNKFVEGMEELREILGKFGSSLLLLEHNHVLMGAFLNIAYSWAELYIILGYYSTNEIKPKLVKDKDHSCFNIIYLHSYLTPEQWSTLSQRITNFGEKPCNQILHKLIVQKLKAILIFEKDIDDEILMAVINDLSLNIEENTELLCDAFCMKNIIPRLSVQQINLISNIFLNAIVEKKIVMRNVYESKLILNGILYNIMVNLKKCVKQKKGSSKIVDILNVISQECFIKADDNEDCLNNFHAIVRSFDKLIRTDNCQASFKCKTDKIIEYLEIIKTLPVLYMTKYVRTVTFVYLCCLLCDLKESQADNLIRETEKILIGIVENGSLLFINETKPSVIITFIAENVKRYEEMFRYMIDMIFKGEESTISFKAGVNNLIKNIDDDKCLQCALVVLNKIAKLKNQHISAEHRNCMQDYKTKICASLENLILNGKTRSTEVFTAVLKFSLSNSDSKLEPLLQHLELYVDIATKELQSGSRQGSLELFLIILNNKSQIKFADSDFVKRTWDVCKDVTIESKMDENIFSKLVMITFDHVSNKDFSLVTQELLKSTLKPLEEHNYVLFTKRINIWNFVLMCSFNVIKCKIWQNSLQTLLQILIIGNVPTDSKHYKEYYGSVLNLTNNLIRKTQLPLTPSIIDTSLVSVTVIMNHNNNFIEAFKTAIAILESLLKTRNALIMDRLPEFLQQYRVLLNNLCDKSNSDVQIDYVDLQNLANCAHLLEKLTRNVVDCGKYVARISPYLISDILKQYETVTLYPSVKLHLNNCIYNLLKLCDQHSITYLLRILSTASTEIFKVVYDDYKKYYRFTGKV